MKHKATAKNVVDVLRRFAAFVELQDAESRRLFARDLNAMLDQQAAQDAFGTEAQCDPRGDQR